MLLEVASELVVSIGVVDVRIRAEVDVEKEVASKVVVVSVVEVGESSVALVVIG